MLYQFFDSSRHLKLVFRPQVVEVHRIHHQATLNLHVSKSVGWKYLRLLQVEFWDWSKYRGDSAEFSAEV
ncbi:hypothetical protein Prudu_412S000200 [Prunus dulcis]|uniref:Uncharacterized protein n=1 Tax=Prunus dulcis TaxID=3755 RepID=A0A5H2XMY7_PRUDU|nr:hypothetical protein Prudu_412S000200 [Prunus dulcis]